MYVDADYANDRITRRSKTGWLIFLDSNLVAYGSRLQTSTARSSTEAEYIAMSMAVKELLWVRNIMMSICFKIKSLIQVREDNQPAIELAENAMASKRTRGMDIKHHWIRHYVENGTIKIVHTHITTTSRRYDETTTKRPFLEIQRLRGHRSGRTNDSENKLKPLHRYATKKLKHGPRLKCHPEGETRPVTHVFSTFTALTKIEKDTL